MPNVTRVTYFFSGFDAGWSEAWHTVLPAGPTLDALITNFTAARRQLLAAQYRIIHVRVSDDLLFRDIQMNVTGLPLSGFRMTGAIPAVNTLSFRMQSGTQIFRNYFAHGLATDIFLGGLFAPSPGYNAAIAVFRNLLKAGQISILAKPTGNTKQLVTASTPADGSMTIAASIGTVAVGTRVQVMNVPTSVLPKRIYRVYEVTDQTHFKLAEWPASINISTFGYLKLAERTLSTCTDCQLPSPSARKVGRPFDVQHGRVRRVA